LQITASDYDTSNNKYVAKKGPDVPDLNGDPTLVSDELNGYPAVDYSTSATSQTDQFATSSDPIAIIWVGRTSSKNDNGIPLDGGSVLELAVNDDNSKDGWRTFRGGSQGSDNAGSVDTDYHIYGLIGQTDGSGNAEVGFEVDGSVVAPLTDASASQLSGITIGGRGDSTSSSTTNGDSCRTVEVVVLNNYESGDKDSEYNRLSDKYAIPLA
jgi:hypothetical protein